MTTTDADFLAQVEDLLTSHDLPLLPSFEETIDEKKIQTLQEHKNNSTSEIQLTGWEMKSCKRIMDAIAKHEIEKAKDRNRRRTYRERRRIERESLQQEIEQLTKELQTIKGSKKRDLALSAWEMIARHQLAARKSSENKQRQLRKAIIVQVAIMKDFRRFVRERIDTPVRKLSSADKIKRIRLEVADTEIFAGFIKELSSVFAQTEKVLKESRLESSEPNWNDPIEAWNHDVNTGYFAFRGKITLPFGFQEICHYRWQSVHQLHLPESRELYDAKDENTLAVKFRRTTRLPSGEIASVLRRLVVRRYEFKDRTVLVWRVFSEGEGFFNGMNADETGWGVITPTDQSSKTGTVLRTCVKNIPMHLSNSEQKGAMKQFSQGLLQWGHENNEKATYGLEKLCISQ